jgi:hypothetical protein
MQVCRRARISLPGAAPRQSCVKSPEPEIWGQKASVKNLEPKDWEMMLEDPALRDQVSLVEGAEVVELGYAADALLTRPTALR